MLRYILKRIILFIPTLFAISLLAFIISINAPGDPVDRLLNVGSDDGAMNQNISQFEKLKRQKRAELGLDLPVFYFGLGTMADIDSLHKIIDAEERETIERLLYKTGNSKLTIAYYLSLKNALLVTDSFETALKYGKQATDTLNLAVADIKGMLTGLLQTQQPEAVPNQFILLDSLVRDEDELKFLSPYIIHAKNAFDNLNNNTQSWKTYIPWLQFYGFSNQYHRWLENIIVRQDFGISYRDQLPVSRRIGDKIKWSVTLSFFSVILAYLLSIPIGVYSAYKRNSWFDKTTAALLFMLYSMPTAFAGTLLLVIFANPDFLNWLPESGVQNELFDPAWPLVTKLRHWAPYLVLPVITFTYGSLAFISRQMRGAMLESLGQDYIQTARAKGISEAKVIWKHAFRNSLLPVITLFANVFPLAVGGAVIIETIFGIPGMGLEIYESVRNYDYPMIVAVFTIFGVLTLTGYLLADILYALADPRISYHKP